MVVKYPLKGLLCSLPTECRCPVDTATASIRIEGLMKRFILLLFLFCTIPAFATTWYVNATGGTRYSVNITSGQCNGQSPTAYPGSGVNQNCAFGDVRYLWTDNSNADSRSHNTSGVPGIEIG